MSSSGRAWDPVLPLLSRHRDVHVVSLPGHRGGPALAWPEQLRTADYVEAVERELDRLGLAEADLVGNSLGGWVALQLAGRGRARSVVCLAPAGGWPAGGAFDRFLAAQFALGYRACRRLASPAGLRWRQHRTVRRALLRSMVARPELVTADQLDELVGAIAECEALRLSIGRAAARDVSAVPRAGCPVLVAWSERDRILISQASRRRLERQVGAPVVTVLGGVGHVPMSDDPGLVAETILGFVVRAEAASPAATPGPSTRAARSRGAAPGRR
jgi:pimeloyl-ACP methyl ester carboxylesterase